MTVNKGRRPQDVRRQLDAICELLVLIRDRVVLPDDIAAKIDTALRE